MSYTLLVYVYAIGLIFICVLPELQEQTVIFECSPPQLHNIGACVLLPPHIITPEAPMALQIQVIADKFKAVHVQLSLPPPIVNETG